MGLCAALSHLRRTHRRARALDHRLQHPTIAFSHRPSAPVPKAEQPSWKRHLELPPLRRALVRLLRASQRSRSCYVTDRASRLHQDWDSDMRIAIIGQQDFGKAVLNAFLERGDEVAAVFCAPEKPGARPDALRLGAEEKGVPVHQFPNYTSAEAQETLRSLKLDIGIMAYVLLFAPQDFVNIPKHGTIQFHPSLLPLHRGPSSINWPIIRGETKTGLTIFRPNDGLDEGPVVLQKETPISPDDTLGTVYFDRLFPMGVKAMLEAADLVFSNKHKEVVQDESQASYEGWVREAESRLNWASPIDMTYN